MKKVLSLILALVLCLSLCACGGDSGSEATDFTQSAGKSEATSEELAQAAQLIKEAEEDVVAAANYQIENWSTSSSIMTYYFVESEYSNAPSGDLHTIAWSIHRRRTSAQEKLDKAKSLIGTNGTSDYYNAVKEYYKTVSVFWNLISEFPEGYSKITFSSTVSDYKTNCANAYSELSFYS